MSIDQRLVMWHEASRLLAGAPQGRGPGSYAAEVLRVKEPSITASGVGRYSLFAQFAHCEPLQFAVEWGVVGLGLLVLGLVLAWAAGGRGAGPAWRLALAGVLVHGLVDFPLRAPPILVLAAVAVGFMTSGERSARKAGNRRLPAGATAALIILGCWLAVEVARPGLARWGREHGRPPDALFDPAIPRAMAAIEMEPRDPWEWMKAGDMLRARGRRAAAREAYRRAIDREPFCLDAYVRLGELARAGGDRREAGRWFRRALILRARLVQRPGLNDYEKELIGYPSEWESRVRGLLLDAGGGK